MEFLGQEMPWREEGCPAVFCLERFLDCLLSMGYKSDRTGDFPPYTVDDCVPR